MIIDDGSRVGLDPEEEEKASCAESIKYVKTKNKKINIKSLMEGSSRRRKLRGLKKNSAGAAISSPLASIG